MARLNIKYEMARNDMDYKERILEQKPINRMQNSFWNTFGKSLVLIGIYFILSVGLTFFQQWLLHNPKINYPLGIVTCHLLVKYILSGLIRIIRAYKNDNKLVKLSCQNVITIIGPPGIASGIDIGSSNWALSLITISLYTMTKSTTIIFILGFSLLFKLEKMSWSLIGVVVMISGGLTMFTYTTQFHLVGFLLCLVASFSSGLRWTMAQLIMQKSKLGLHNPIDMMYYMQPIMLIVVTPMALWFEGEKLFIQLQSIEWSKSSGDLWSHTTTILIGAILAFSMEIMEFMVVTHTSSLTLSISGIVKEIFTLILAFEWKGDQLNLINFFGLLLCFGGIILHVTKKILYNKKEINENVELHSNIMTNNADKKKHRLNEDPDLNVPLLKDKSSININMKHFNFSTDDDDNDDHDDVNENLTGKTKSDSSDVLFHILHRREQL